MWTRGGSGKVGKLWGRSNLLEPSLLSTSSTQASSAAFPAPGARRAGAALSLSGFQFLHLLEDGATGALECLLICGSKPSPPCPPFSAPMRCLYLLPSHKSAHLGLSYSPFLPLQVTLETADFQDGPTSSPRTGRELTAQACLGSLVPYVEIRFFLQKRT